MEGTIDKYGNFYFAVDTLYSFDFNGNVRWKFFLGGLSYSSIVNDSYGNIYLGVGTLKKFISVNNEGNLLWSVDIPEEFNGHSPAIGNNERIYIPSFKSKKVFAIK